MITQNKSTLTYLSIIAVLLLSLIFSVKTCHKNKVNQVDQTNLINSLNDSIIQFKNKYDESVTTISVIQTENPKILLNLQTKIKEIVDLQAKVREYSSRLRAGSSVTQATIETLLEATRATQITKYDTVIIDNKDYRLVNIYPTYEDSLKNKYIDYYTRINKDSSKLRLKVFNTVTAVIGVDKRKPFVDLILDNPYSHVKTLRTYQVSLPKPKRWGIGPSAGVTYIGNKFIPYGGIGLNYNLIRF